MNVLSILFKNTSIVLVTLLLSNFASLQATPIPHLVSTQSNLAGKVFNDKDNDGYQDMNEEGIVGIRIATVTGLIIVTDSNGRYKIPAYVGETQNWGSNLIIKLDPSSLPYGSSLTTENPRMIRFADSSLGRIDFGVQLP